MKILKIFVLGFLCLGFLIADVGDVWTQLSSAGQLNWAKIVCSADGQKVIAIQDGNNGVSGYLYISDNGGQDWHTAKNDQVRNWSTLAMSADGQHIAVGINGGNIFISHDGGNAWVEKEVPAQKIIGNINISNNGQKIAYVLRYDDIVCVSSDGGQTWIEQTLALGGSYTHNLAGSADGARLLVLGFSGSFFSTDSGQTWQSTTDFMGANGCQKLFWVGNTNTVYSVFWTKGGRISYSSDGGNTWQEYSGNYQTNPWTGVFGSADGSKLYFSAYNNYLYSSNDQLQTIQEIINSGQKNWTDITCSSDGMKIFATEGDGYIYYSTYVAPAIPAYLFQKDGDLIKYKRQTETQQEIAEMSFSESAINIGTIITDNFSDVVMMVLPEGKPFLIVPEDNQIAQAVNNANGALWVTASFQVSQLMPVMMNGKQISDSKGNVFPEYRNYVENISFADGTMTFRIKHFTEYGVPVLIGKAFAGTASGQVISAAGSNLVVQALGFSVSGDAAQNRDVIVQKISGLAYETVLSDVPSTLNNLYKPLTPGTEYGISFEYINRGNATDEIILNRSLTGQPGHYSAVITESNKTVAAWQVVSFDIKTNAVNAAAFERATIDVNVSVNSSAVVSYNGYSGAYRNGTFGEDGLYGGVNDLNYTFILEAEGYNVSILNRIVSVNAPAGPAEDLIPGSKIVYSIVIKNNSTAVATSVNVADLIPNNCHLYYTDAPDVTGADFWEWKGAINNNATAADLNAVKFEITIPASGIITASYTVTLD